MEEEYSLENAKAFILNKFTEQGDFLILPSDVLDAMLTRVMALDEEFMEKSGVNDGAEYDDDAAFDALFETMTKEFPDQKMYCMRFVDDYLEYSEQYLDSIGAIEWE
ncbi:MAG: hypothetical protein IJK01_05035 [Clostridia bacterium]|jgi:hypothetical protein|nr:hypothetical protein [Clostridia bacterium]